MMPIVQKFIEENIDLLENDPVEFYVRAWEENKLDNQHMQYMCFALHSAGIENVAEDRRLAMLQILDTQISDWGIAEGGVSAMPIKDFIEVFLDNRLGYSIEQVQEIMFDEADRWDNYAELYVDDNNIPIVARR